MAAKKAAAKKAAARRKAPAKKAAAEPAAKVHTFTPGKTKRMRAAGFCPGGVGVLDRETGSCGRCESADTCEVARFAPGE